MRKKVHNREPFISETAKWQVAYFDATLKSMPGIILTTVPKHVPEREPATGQFYRDLDGEVVRLLEVKKNLCTWAPVCATEQSRQVTHRDNFVRRFTRVAASLKKVAA